MTITDTVGRSMLVDLMYKDGSRWLLAPEHKLKGCGTRFVEVPYSQFAIKIESLIGADVIVFENGRELIKTSVPARTQYITADANGLAFTFRPEGDTTPGAKVLDSVVHKQLVDEHASAEVTVEDAGALPNPQPKAPEGHGLVYVVVRFAKQDTPYGQPPQEEFEIAFQLQDATTADAHLAAHMHMLAQPPAAPNPADLFSRDPAPKEVMANRPKTYCTFCNQNH